MILWKYGLWFKIDLVNDRYYIIKWDLIFEISKLEWINTKTQTHSRILFEKKLKDNANFKFIS